MADSDTQESQTPEEAARAARLAKWFDIRRIIGALFLLYGIVITVTGVAGSHATKTKAAGINIDLWGGIGLLIFAAVMIAWSLLRPTPPPDEPQEQPA
jgi:NADH:ubiquinone oxidoreductase subunit 6 (subunit J)